MAAEFDSEIGGGSGGSVLVSRPIPVPLVSCMTDIGMELWWVFSVLGSDWRSRVKTGSRGDVVEVRGVAMGVLYTEEAGVDDWGEGDVQEGVGFGSGRGGAGAPTMAERNV